MDEVTQSEASEAARALGRIRTAKKAQSSRENGTRYGGRPVAPLSEISCTCGAGDSEKHPTTCPRGRAIRRREKAAAGEANARS